MRILTLFLCSAHGAVALSPLSTKASLQGHELAGPTPVHDGANTSVVWQHSAEVRAAAASNLVALRHRAQSGLMESAALLRTAHLNPRAVVVSLMLDIAVIGCSFLYVHYHWAEWTKMSQAASASRGGIVDEVLKQIIQLFDRNKDAGQKTESLSLTLLAQAFFVESDMKVSIPRINERRRQSCSELVTNQ
eukprot:3269818-Amphidinium_carterae.1